MQKAILLILDGWGVSDENTHNAIYQAQPKFWNKLISTYPNSRLHAREESVGLTKGCLSGSEVGHTIIGAGRIIRQQVAKVDYEIESGDFYNNKVLAEVKKYTEKNNSTVHMVGILSDGGIHSHINHLYALIDWAKKNEIKSVALHLFLDGRDVPPTSAKKYLEPLMEKLDENIEISTLCGRDILDRNEKWEKTVNIFHHLTQVKNKKDISPLEFVDKNYAEKITDEFMMPANFSDKVIQDNDAVIFFNFRADRMRQLARLFVRNAPHTVLNEIKVPENLLLTSLSEYGDIFETVKVIYPKEMPKNSLGEWLSKKGLKQFRVAEGEKYAHITYFFNGGHEVVFENESRVVIPSLGLSNYATQPEMSLPEVKNTLLRAIESKEYDFIVCNIANGDMVGHSGDMSATLKAVTIVDSALSEIVEQAKGNGYTVIITSDHGNCESMFLENEPHTSHTFNDVPLIVTDEKINLNKTGYLHQIAPTILDIMGIEKPEEMTSESLVIGS